MTHPSARRAAVVLSLVVAVLAAAPVAAAPVPELVSVDAAGVPGDAPSGYTGRAEIALSASGRHVAFTSEASNLVPGDRNGRFDVFVVDRARDTIERIGAGDGPALSADGRMVAFSAGVARESRIVLHDRRSGRVRRVPVLGGGRRVASFNAAISGDGRVVAFAAVRLGPFEAEPLGVFVFDARSGRTTRVEGPEVVDLVRPALSAGGRHVAFVTASRLVAADRDRRPDAYVVDRRTGRATLASAEADRSAGGLSLSANGRMVAYESSASRRRTRVLVRDLRARRTVDASAGLARDATAPALSRDGRAVAFQASPRNGPIGDARGPIGEVFVRDLAGRRPTPITVGSRRSGFPAAARGGRIVAFASTAALDPADGNRVADVYLLRR